MFQAKPCLCSSTNRADSASDGLLAEPDFAAEDVTVAGVQVELAQWQARL